MADSPSAVSGTPLTPGIGLKTPFGSVDVAVQWRDLSYTVEDKEILKGLSGNMLPRRCLAIMGSTGAGKTTFLNGVSSRLAHDNKHRVAGELKLNGVKFQHRDRRLVGFVTQDDVLLPTSTPDESLSFSLRVRRGTDPVTTNKKVDSMLAELNLEKARDTIVGQPGLTVGLSGGERKRTNIGLELITDPKVLLLDEPTSGLDSVTASTVCSLLHDLSRRGRTIAYTIHQPTSDTCKYFDDLMLMVAGKTVYHGPMENATEYFASLGFECPEHYTPTDYFMTIMQSEETGPRLVEMWEKHLVSMGPDGRRAYPYIAADEADDTDLIERTKSYLTAYEDVGARPLVQLAELLKRSFRNVARNKMYLVASIVQAVVFGIIAALIFIRLKDSQTGVADRHGLIFMVVANIGFSSIMGVVNNFPPLRAVYIRDQQSGSYSPFFYFIAHMVSELPVQIVSIILSSVLIYFPTQLALSAEAYFLFVLVAFAMQQIGVGIGMCISVGVENYTVASGLTPLIVMPMILAGGFLASTDQLRPGWIWLEKISFIRYATVLLEKNEFERLDNITCDVAKFGPAFCSRAPTNGRQVLHTLQFDDDHHATWLMWTCMGIFLVLTRVLSIALLYVVGRRKN